MSLQELLLDEIRDLYHAEKQLIKALPKLAKAATHEDLREAIESHLEETREQVARLEEVFEVLGEKVRAKTCTGMQGIIEEGSELIQEEEEGPILDAGIIAAAQRAEHYEMAAYGTCVAWARLLGLDEVASLLDQTLEEEKSADKKLSALAEQEVNLNAVNVGNEEQEEEESPRRRVSARRQSSSGRSTRARAADRSRR